MSTLTAILEADVDGTLHLPLPVELRYGKVKVTAFLGPARTAEVESQGRSLETDAGPVLHVRRLDEPLEEESGVTPPQSELGSFAPPCG